MLLGFKCNKLFGYQPKKCLQNSTADNRYCITFAYLFNKDFNNGILVDSKLYKITPAIAQVMPANTSKI